MNVRDCNGVSIANIPLQFAWNVKTATEIVDKWQGSCKILAANQVCIDYLFILAYVSLLFFIGLRCERAAARREMPTLAFIGRLSAWGGLLAGVFDCFENIGLLTMIHRGPATPVPSLTTLCASAKSALLANSAGVGLVTLEAVVVHWWRRRESSSAPDDGQRK